MCPLTQSLTRDHGFRYLYPPHRKCWRLDLQKTPAAWTAKYRSQNWVCLLVWFFYLCCARLNGVLCRINVSSTKSSQENNKYLLSGPRQKYILLIEKLDHVLIVFLITNTLKVILWVQTPLLKFSIVKPDELVQLKPFEKTDCLKSLKFINSKNVSIKKIFDVFPSNSITNC